MDGADGMSIATEAVERGSHWRRKTDGRIFEVVHVIARKYEPTRVQFKPAEAKNLKNTRWCDLDNVPNLYAPSDAQPLLGHAQRFREMFGVSADASPYLELGLRFDYGQPWAVEALDFFRRYPQARWHWMDVPANGDYHVLTLKVVIDGVHVEMGGGSHFTLVQAKAITEDFRAIRAAAKAAEPAPPEPEHRCPRCAHGWDDA